MKVYDGVWEEVTFELKSEKWMEEGSMQRRQYVPRSINNREPGEYEET